MQNALSVVVVDADANTYSFVYHASCVMSDEVPAIGVIVATGSSNGQSTSLRLVRIGPPGAERPAVLDADDRVLDLTELATDIDATFLADDGIARVRSAVEAGSLAVVEDVDRFGPCIARPGKIVCVGLNYRKHALEAGMDLPSEPLLFFKAPNSIVGPHDAIHIPPGGEKVDWEIELAIVMGGRARYLADEDAAAATIAGYTISNDVSEREFQLEHGGQWVKGKSCETFNPIGPWLVPAEDIPDVQKLGLELMVNGERMQHGNTADMLFSAAHVVWYVSQYMVLEPGDVINTGTPFGVGMGLKPPRYLQAGDVVELEIERLGRQRQEVVHAPR